MRRSIRIVLIVFAVIMTLFSIYQFLLGNPFLDDVSPVLVTFAFLILAGLALTAFIKKD